MKRSIAWGIAALASIGYLGAMVVTGAMPEFRNRVKFQAQGVMAVAPERIDRVEIDRDGERTILARTGNGGWSQAGGDAVPAAVAEKVSLAVQYMHTANPVRAVTGSEIREFAPGEFGLERPRISVALFAGEERVLLARFGSRNPEDMLQYMTIDGRDDLYLMSRFVGQEWESTAEALQPR